MRQRVRLIVPLVAAAVVAVGLGVWSLSRDLTGTTPIDWVVASPSGTQVSVTFAAGRGEGCPEPLDVQVSETSREVRLTARTITRSRIWGTPPCPAVGVLSTTSVRLSAPLGSRVLIDDGRQATDEPAPLRNRFGDPTLEQ